MYMPQVLVNGYITRDMSHCQLFTQLSYVVGNHRLFEKKKKKIKEKKKKISTIL
jgi:hypothetical protein